MTSSSSEARRLGEFQLIAKYFAPLSANATGALGLSDDAARVRPRPGRELVVTTDALVEGVHFFKTDPARSIAHKALRVNLSDLAAKGAEPEFYLLALSLPDWVDEDWLAQFAGGLGDDQARFGVALLGGDTTATPGPLTLAVTAIGNVAEGGMILRSGARPGDSVFVSGTVGDAGVGLAILRGEETVASGSARDFLVDRYRLPEPRLALGRALVGLATAALDVSDGLIADLGHIAETSSVRVVIETARIPLSPSFVAVHGTGAAAAIRAATAGDDYEIAFTAPASAREAVAATAKLAGASVAEIGRVERGSGVIVLDAGGRPIPVERPGFAHF